MTVTLVFAGDSITIAPAQTLTDKEYQRLRDASIAIIRDMGVECGGSNVQMAVNPDDGQVECLLIFSGHPQLSVVPSSKVKRGTCNAIIAMVCNVAIECGGSKVQMAVNPDDGQVGFPCAHMARASYEAVSTM